MKDCWPVTLVATNKQGCLKMVGSGVLAVLYQGYTQHITGTQTWVPVRCERPPRGLPDALAWAMRPGALVRVVEGVLSRSTQVCLFSLSSDSKQNWPFELKVQFADLGGKWEPWINKTTMCVNWWAGVMTIWLGQEKKVSVGNHF